MKKLSMLSWIMAGALSVGLFTSCSDEIEGNGTIGLSLTDAPTDAENVQGVYITITGVEYQKEGQSWQPFEGFSGPNTLNLLDLQDGKTALLGDFSVEAGNYEGLRFKLDASANGGDVSNEATYIAFTDGSKEPLFVPSGTQSGYKALGNFTVPVNGNVFITADFDVRKSVVEAGKSGKYLLKPTIRLVVNDQAGTIFGTVSGADASLDYVVFTYANGTYTEAEAAEPAEGEVRFPGAVSSAKVKEDGSFILPFLAPASYQLVVAAYQNGQYVETVLVSAEASEVKSLKETNVSLSL